MAEELPEGEIPTIVLYDEGSQEDVELRESPGTVMVTVVAQDPNLVQLKLLFPVESVGRSMELFAWASKAQFMEALNKVKQKYLSGKHISGGWLNGTASSLVIEPIQNGSAKVLVKFHYQDLEPTKDSRLRAVKTGQANVDPQYLSPAFPYTLTSRPKDQMFLVGTTVHQWPATAVIVLGNKNFNKKLRRVLIVERTELYNEDTNRIRVYLVPERALRTAASSEEYRALRKMAVGDWDEEEKIINQEKLRRHGLLSWTHGLVDVQTLNGLGLSPAQLFDERIRLINESFKKAKTTGSSCRFYLYEQAWANSPGEAH